MIFFNLHPSEQLETILLFTQIQSKVTKDLNDPGAELKPELTEMWNAQNILEMWSKLNNDFHNVCINQVPPN